MTKILKIFIHGIAVWGRVLLDSDAIAQIEILKPYRGYTILYVLPTMIRAGPTRIIRKRMSPSEILRRLYDICKRVEENQDSLIEALDQLETKCSELIIQGLLPDNVFLMLKKAHRNSRVDGNLTESEYEKQMLDIRVRHSLYHQRLHELREEWFGSNFGDDVDADLQAQIIDRLRLVRDEREE